MSHEARAPQIFGAGPFPLLMNRNQRVQFVMRPIPVGGQPSCDVGREDGGRERDHVSAWFWIGMEAGARGAKPHARTQGIGSCA